MAGISGGGTTEFPIPVIDEAVDFTESGVTLSGHLDTPSNGGVRITYPNLIGPSFQNSLDVSTQDTDPTDVVFNGDGSKLYITGDSSDSVYSYALSTAYDVTTASFQNSLDVSGQDTAPQGVTFNGDGSKLYVIGFNSDSVHSYSLSTAYDITTATYQNSLDVSGQATSPTGMTFNGDGTKLYIVGGSSTSAHSYALSTAYDITTASFQNSLDVSGQDSNPHGVVFNSDGTKMYVAGVASAAVYEYVLSTAYDITTATQKSSFDVSGQDTAPQGMAFNGNKAKMYIAAGGSDAALSYNLTPPDGVHTTVEFPPRADVSSWYTMRHNVALDGASATVDILDLDNMQYASTFDASTQDSSLRGVTFNGDGSKLYVIGDGSDSVHSYSLSTAYDITTASFQNSLDVSGQDTGPQGVTFNGDGSKLYIIGFNSDSVHSYSLSTAYDITTASFQNSLDVSGQDTAPQSVVFNGDGSKLYITGDSSDSVYSYALSTAYDITTASFQNSLDVSKQDTAPREIAFNGDGSKLYVAGSKTRSIYSYALSTAYDITTASPYRSSFDVSDEDNPRGLVFNGDGSKLYIVGYNTGYVHSYTLSNPYELVGLMASDVGRTADASVVPANHNAAFRITYDTVPNAATSTLEYVGRRGHR